MTAAYIALGSNLGDSRALLRSALADLAELPDTRLESISPAYLSEAIGPGEQPDYINLAVRLETGLSAETLLVELQRIELAHGRERGERWAARTLDLDILLYGNEHIDKPGLKVPHPGIPERSFVLIPLLDLDANLTLPCGTPIGSLLARCPHTDLRALGEPIEPGRS